MLQRGPDPRRFMCRHVERRQGEERWACESRSLLRLTSNLGDYRRLVSSTRDLAQRLIRVPRAKGERVATQTHLALREHVADTGR